MFSNRLFAQLGILAAIVVLIGSMSVLLHGRESIHPPQQAIESPQAEQAPPQVVFGQVGTSIHR